MTKKSGALVGAQGVNTGPKLTPFHRLKTDPPDRVHRSLLVVDGRLLCSEVRV